MAIAFISRWWMRICVAELRGSYVKVRKVKVRKVKVRKATLASRQRTSLSLTVAGRTALDAHVAELRGSRAGWQSAADRVR
jgi:hypothetical protein